MFLRRLLPAWFQAAESTQAPLNREIPINTPAAFQETDTEYGTLIDLEAQIDAANSKEAKESTASSTLPTNSSAPSQTAMALAPIDLQPTVTISAPNLTLTSSLALDLGEENESDNDTTPLLPSSRRPPTPPATSYQQLSNYSYFTGVFCGTLWGGLGATVKNLPVLFQFSGAAVMSAIAVELLLTQANSSNPAINKEQARKKLLFTAIGTALATNSLELLLVGATGTWAAPLIMIGAKVLAPTVETQLTRALPRVAANLSLWWNSKPRSDGEHKKFDLETEDSKRFSYP